MSPYASAIDGLLGRRNAIAHGEDIGGVKPGDYKRYEDAFLEVTGRLTDHLFEALEYELFRRETAVERYSI